MKQLRVYLSSTFEDLKEYRTAVFAALEKAGLSVARMEAYTAADERPLDLCLRDVAQSDIYVGIYAWRYGYEPPAAHGNPHGKSISELEYRQAESETLRKLLFFAHPDTKADWPDRFKDEVTGEGKRGKKLTEFQKELGTEKTASFFSTPDELATLVLAAIMRSGLVGRPYNVPPREAGFVARPHLTKMLVESLVDAGGAGVSTVLQGAGGFGKTTLAIDACHHVDMVNAFPDGMLWIALGEKPELAKKLGDLHVLASGSPPPVSDIVAIEHALAKALDGRRVLVVIDDAWRADDLLPFLALNGPRLLITTRLRNLVEQAAKTSWPEVTVDEMEAGEAAALLGHGLTCDELTRDKIQVFADRLRCWPLLLDLANARLLEEQKTRRGKLAECIDRVTKLFERRGVLSFDRRDSTARNAAVGISIEVGLEVAEEGFPGITEKAAEISVFPDDAPIPIHVLADLWELDEFDVEEDAVRPLDNLSILHWNRESGEVSLHDMVRRALEAKLAEPVAVHRKLIDAWGSPFHLPYEYAWRWIGWHLYEAGRQDELRALLLDVSWMQIKLAHVGVHGLLGDYEFLRNDLELRQIRDALRLSESAISLHPELISAQLEARLPSWSWLQITRSLAAPSQRYQLRSRTPALAQVGGPLKRAFPLPGVNVTSVAPLPDGRRLMLGCERLGMIFFDLANGELTPFCQTDGWIDAIAVSRDGRWIANAVRHSTKEIHSTNEIHCMEDSSIVRRLSNYTSAVKSLDFSNDGRFLLSAGWDNTIRVWDAYLATEHRVLHSLPGNGVDDKMVENVRTFSDREQAITVETDRVAGHGVLRIWNFVRGSEVRCLPCAQFPRVMAISRTNRLVACSSSTTQVLITLTDIEQGELTTYLSHESKGMDNASSLAFSPDDRWLIAGTRSGNLLIWELQGQTLRSCLDAHDKEIIYAQIFEGELTTVARDQFEDPVTSERNSEIKVWQGDIGAIVSVLEGGGRIDKHDDDVEALALSESCNQLASGSHDMMISVWNVDTCGRQLSIEVPRGDGVHVVSVNENAGLISSLTNISQDCGEVCIWRLSDGALVRKISTRDLAYSAAITANGQHILVGTGWHLDVYGIVKAKAKRKDKRNDEVSAISFSGWDFEADPEEQIRQGKNIGDIREYAHEGGLCLAGDHLAAVGLRNGFLQLWNFVSRERLRHWKGHEKNVDALTVVKDGRLLISTSTDGMIKLWDLETTDQVGELRTIGLGVRALAATPDGRRIVTGSRDGTARVWDLMQRKEIAIFSADYPLSSCAISGDGIRIFLGDTSGRVHFLQMDAVQ